MLNRRAIEVGWRMELHGIVELMLVQPLKVKLTQHVKYSVQLAQNMLDNIFAMRRIQLVFVFVPELLHQVGTTLVTRETLQPFAAEL